MTTSNIHFVEKLWIHEDFNRIVHVVNDIAILKLENPIKRSSSVSIACFSNNDPLDSKMIVAGWGSNTSDYLYRTPTDKLQQTILNILDSSDSRCKSVNGTLYSNNTFCTLDLTNKLSNTCFGDSGNLVFLYSSIMLSSNERMMEEYKTKLFYQNFNLRCTFNGL
jgi:hypothetical protein